MIFSQHMAETARAGFLARLEQAGPDRGAMIRAQLDSVSLSGDAAAAVQWLYANSPLSDLANYDFTLFLSGALHGVFLRENSPFAKDLPEDVFLNYVLHIRVNEEELCSCRRTFFDSLWERVKNRSARDAAIEINYWNAEQATYQSTDVRTISALGVCRSGYGRCGEESAFAVNAFRSVGIPARQIYTPLWAHCDDNHAWVEVWVDGGWHFLGACEPEEILDRGWFTNASGRAMLIYSRCFGEPCKGEEVIFRKGMAYFLNNLRRYAPVRELTVLVKDETGAPVPGAEVSFGILNYSSVGAAAAVCTGEDGTARLTCGLGSLSVHVKKGDVFCERMVFVPEEDTVEFVLKRDAPAPDVWEDFVSIAPKDQIFSGGRPTEEQKQLGREKAAAAKEIRERRTAAMFDPQRARRVVGQYGYSEEIYELLFESRGNFPQLLAFLEDGAFPAEEKEALLLTLSKKDRRDVDPDVLREALALARRDSAMPDEIFYPYVVCPRVFSEPLRKNRRFILDFFPPERQAAFREDPKEIWKYIQTNIGFHPEWEYGQIVTLPAGALTVKNASPLSQKILFVSICRALGKAARMNPANRQAEYYAEGRFVPVETPSEQGCGTVALERAPGESWQYGPDFTLGVLEDGAYQTLQLEQEQWEDCRMTLTVPAGQYRVITDNRLPNGNIHAGKYRFHLADGETKTIRLRKAQASLSEMLDNFRLDDFQVSDGAGQPVKGSALTGNGKTVLLWLEEGMEPTEHILNEMLEQEADFQTLPAEIVFLTRGKAALENAKLKKVLHTFPQIKVYYDSFVPNVETIARRMYVDPEKLPLIVVTTGPLNAVYACSGYNVGSGDMLVKICGL